MIKQKKVIKETWNLADLALENKDYELRRKCLNDIMNHTITLTLNKLVDFLPAICSMRMHIWDEEIKPHAINTNTNTAAIDYGNKALNIQ